MPRGGPDGGDGGHGGDVVLVCDSSRRDLAALKGSKHFRGGRGKHGEGSNRHGARGEDREILVPAGTQAEAVDGSSGRPGRGRAAGRGRSRRGVGGTGTSGSPTRPGRRRGLPRRGPAGEEGWIELRLKLLADVGLIGLPNAGKSSLLGRLTRAAPKVADYPFTTLSPVLGTIESEDRQAIVADIPGLIEGAAEGAGLGHEFLAHVERCAMLVHLVELAPLEGEPVANYEAVRAELSSYGGGLDRLPELVVLSKRDLLPPDAGRRRRSRSGGSGSATARSAVLAVSSATGEGLDELREQILAALPETAAGPPRARRRAARRVRGRAPRLPPGRRGRLLGRARGRRRLPRHSAAASSCSSSATTSPTKRRSPTSSSGSTRSASSPPCAPPASSPATTSASASTSSSCTREGGRAGIQGL